MNFDFELILFYAVIVCGVIALFDKLFLEKKRIANYVLTTQNSAQPREMKLPIIIDYAKSFFPILLIVFLFRSFAYEPFRIPSGSLEPTLLIGDFIVVNKFDYGMRLPVVHKKFFGSGMPQRGDILVFRSPANPSMDLIKRVIGLPGDHIKYVDKILYLNGQEVAQDIGKPDIRIDEEGNKIDVIKREENLLGVKHAIFQNPTQQSENYEDIIVPPGMYFMMGDNRDDSSDSRYWGFMPEKNIIGKAVLIWLSWDSVLDTIRWHRFGKSIH